MTSRAGLRFARLWAACAAAFLVFAVARNAAAHPAGFTSINRYIGVSVSPDGNLRIAYLLDFAEMPSYAEIDLLDADRDGQVSPEEQRKYLDARIHALVAQWTVEIDGVKSVPRVTGSSLEILVGERGLSTLRIAADVTVERAIARGVGAEDTRVHVVDRAFADHPGWREIAAQDSPDARVTAGFKEAPAGALAYVTGARPPRVDEADFGFRLAANPAAADPAPIALPRPALDPRLARLSYAMKRASGSWPFSMIALGLAVVLGAAHALSPGHGKALAAAYLVGRRARASQAGLFGVTVAAAHTIVVFVIGGLAVAVERTIGSSRLIRGLELLSVLTVVVLGLVQLSRRWREAAHDAQGHAHAAAVAIPPDAGVRSVVALGTSSGLTPCPSALAVLLTAIAIHRYGFGLILVLAFSVGVAFTLTTTGLLVLWARRLLDGVRVAAPLLRWLPVLSSACVLLVGVLLCVSACAAPP